MDDEYRNRVRERFLELGRKHNWFDRPLAEKIAQIKEEIAAQGKTHRSIFKDIEKGHDRNDSACVVIDDDELNDAHVFEDAESNHGNDSDSQTTCIEIDLEDSPIIRPKRRNVNRKNVIEVIDICDSPSAVHTDEVASDIDEESSSHSNSGGSSSPSITEDVSISNSPVQAGNMSSPEESSSHSNIDGSGSPSNSEDLGISDSPVKADNMSSLEESCSHSNRESPSITEDLNISTNSPVKAGNMSHVEESCSHGNLNRSGSPSIAEDPNISDSPVKIIEMSFGEESCSHSNHSQSGTPVITEDHNISNSPVKADEMSYVEESRSHSNSDRSGSPFISEHASFSNSPVKADNMSYVEESSSHSNRDGSGSPFISEDASFSNSPVEDDGNLNRSGSPSIAEDPSISDSPVKVNEMSHVEESCSHSNSHHRESLPVTEDLSISKFSPLKAGNVSSHEESYSSHKNDSSNEADYIPDSPIKEGHVSYVEKSNSHYKNDYLDKGDLCISDSATNVGESPYLEESSSFCKNDHKDNFMESSICDSPVIASKVSFVEESCSHSSNEDKNIVSDSVVKTNNASPTDDSEHIDNDLGSSVVASVDSSIEQSYLRESDIICDKHIDDSDGDIGIDDKCDNDDGDDDGEDDDDDIGVECNDDGDDNDIGLDDEYNDDGDDDDVNDDIDHGDDEIGIDDAGNDDDDIEIDDDDDNDIMLDDECNDEGDDNDVIEDIDNGDDEIGIDDACNDDDIGIDDDGDDDVGLDDECNDNGDDDDVNEDVMYKYFKQETHSSTPLLVDSDDEDGSSESQLLQESSGPKSSVICSSTAVGDTALASPGISDSPVKASLTERLFKKYNPEKSETDATDDFEHFLKKIRTPKQSKVFGKERDAGLNAFIVDDDEDVFYDPGYTPGLEELSDDDKENESSIEILTPASRINTHFKTPKSSKGLFQTPSSTTSSASFASAKSRLLSSTSSRPRSVLDSVITPYTNEKEFKKNKDNLVRELFELYNRTVFDNQLPSDFKITWNPRMRSTAGFCYYSKKNNIRMARIELADKVIDSADRLRDTLIHEMCHAAAWMISGVKAGHGAVWKKWTYRAHSVHQDLPPISRCHSYTINAKYTYRCTNSGCANSFGRHSKSVNLEKSRCAYCRSRLELVPQLKKDGTPQSRTPNKFALFVKQHYSRIKSDNGTFSHQQVMKTLSTEFAKLSSS